MCGTDCDKNNTPKIESPEIDGDSEFEIFGNVLGRVYEYGL